jgi:hypothetical protein
MRASGRWRRARRSAAARGGGLAGAALDRAAVHQIVRRWALRVAKAFAHVTEESRGTPVPRRRPAPEGGGAVAPARSHTSIKKNKLYSFIPELPRDLSGWILQIISNFFSLIIFC